MNVLVADDHEFVRGGLVSGLAEILPDGVFFEAGNACETLKQLKQDESIQLLILDLYMPGSNQYELVEKICSDFPQLKVIVMTASEEANDMQAVIDCGAAGYIPKTQGKDIVHHAVLLVLAGGTYFPSDILNKASSQPVGKINQSKLEKSISKLTLRQKDVLTYLLKGDSNKNIANTLEISENTVKIHVTAILKMLNFNNRSQVIAGIREAEIRM